MEGMRGTPLSAKNVWTTAGIAPQVPQPVQLPFASGAFHSITDFWAQGAGSACHASFPGCGAYSPFPDNTTGIENQFRGADHLRGGDLLGARLDLLHFASPVLSTPNMSSPLAIQSLPHDLMRPPMDLPSMALGQTVSPPLNSPLPTDLHVDLQQQFSELEYREALKNVLVENVNLHKQLEVAAVSPSSSEKEDSLRHTLVSQQHENCLLTDEVTQLRKEKEEWAKEKCALLRELQQYQSSVTQHDTAEKQLRSRNEQLFQETQQLALALQQLTNRNLALLEEVETHKRSKQRSRQEASKTEERACGDDSADQAASPAKLELALQEAELRAKELSKENHETMEVLKQLTEQTQALLTENARLSTCYTKSEQRVQELTALVASSEHVSEALLDVSDTHFEGIIDCTESVHFSQEEDLSGGSAVASSNAASVCLECVDVLCNSAVDEAETSSASDEHEDITCEQVLSCEETTEVVSEELSDRNAAWSAAQAETHVAEEAAAITDEASSVVDQTSATAFCDEN